MPDFVGPSHKLIIELQRWRPAVPAAVPHRVTAEDTFNGWTVPKGATVIGNTWAIGRDPEYFPDGDTFRPERYMPGPERDKIMAGLSKGHTSFGHGRRICPGLNLAERSLAVSIAQIFWAFDVVPDPNAGEIDPCVPAENHVRAILMRALPRYNFTQGFVWHARPFKVSVRPRSAQKAALIRSEGGTALEEMMAAFQ